MITFPVGFITPTVVGTAAWSPALLPGAYYWFDASYGIGITGGNQVISWQEKISNTTFTVTSTGKPTYTSSDAVFNNRPTVNFPKDGTNTFWLDGPTGAYASQDVFMWQVYLLRTSDNNENMLLSFTTPPGSYNGYFNGGGSSQKNEFLFSDLGTRNISPLSPIYNTAVFFFGRFAAGSPNVNALWDNQTAITSSTNIGSLLPAGALTTRIGNINPTTDVATATAYQFDGKVAELGLCFGTVTNTDVTTLITYITTKYGITPTP